jgi:hypothetical protein
LHYFKKIFAKIQIFFKFSKNKLFFLNFQKIKNFKKSKNFQKKIQKFKKSILTDNLTRFIADNLEKHLLALLTVFTNILHNFQYFSWLFKDAEMIIYRCEFGVFFDAFMRVNLDLIDAENPNPNNTY